MIAFQCILLIIHSFHIQTQPEKNLVNAYDNASDLVRGHVTSSSSSSSCSSYTIHPSIHIYLYIVVES